MTNCEEIVSSSRDDYSLIIDCYSCNFSTYPRVEWTLYKINPSDQASGKTNGTN